MLLFIYVFKEAKKSKKKLFIEFGQVWGGASHINTANIPNVSWAVIYTWQMVGWWSRLFFHFIPPYLLFFAIRTSDRRSISCIWTVPMFTLAYRLLHRRVCVYTIFSIVRWHCIWFSKQIRLNEPCGSMERTMFLYISTSLCQ